MNSFYHQMRLGMEILEMPYSQFLVYREITKGMHVDDRCAILEQILAEVQEQ